MSVEIINLTSETKKGKYCFVHAKTKIWKTPHKKDTKGWRKFGITLEIQIHDQNRKSGIETFLKKLITGVNKARA